MRIKVLGIDGRDFARMTAILAAGSFLAGCSSGAMRFDEEIFTASTANQRAILGAAVDQPFPGDVSPRPAPVDRTYTGSVNRRAVEPVAVGTAGVQRQTLPPAAREPMPARPVEVARAEPVANDRMAVPAAPRQAAATPAPVGADEGGEGWTRAGGTQVTVREGETLYNLSRRFGVPVKAIMKVNNMASADDLSAGQKVVIPTYVYSRKAPISAPDANPEVMAAKSSRGSRYDVPADKVPVPSRSPDRNVAILPQTPKPKQRVAAAETSDVTAQKSSATPSPAKAGLYTVVAGDTLYGIARQRGTTAQALKQANGLADGHLRIGQKLRIPAPGAVVVVADEPVDPVMTASTGGKRAADATKSPVTAYTPPEAANSARTSSDKAITDTVTKSAAIAPEATGVERMRWPVRGRVIAGYGRKAGSKPNDGIDIAVPEGTPVKAAENGVVIYAGDGLKEFGNTVLVRHEDGLVTVYGHASQLTVARGDKVRRGQEIARSGMSGSADLPKLHFEVRKDSVPVNPTGYLE
ncbi:peptidoglycan DD-metalloendopeptidase family protein [Nitratireductor sp. CAU 1489]|uniref:Peptidoglycan DD-metalloendopeptidase family protein n=1 Tax=Nitratireductor arenosus TaxID=2682096 RepID=A0A844QG32_9HYPH|nr:peptidoglycan DD-metalloendopeptidase family protein [Nitratireductor arenosus]MVA97574.1 peptidoglycan DD-metalloendopeptidase family protein [Nitratireductor arenosus]